MLKGGPKLKKATESSRAEVRVGRYIGNRTMTQLSQFLGSVVDRPVVDRTDFSGVFEIHLTYVSPRRNAGSASRSRSPPFAGVKRALRRRLLEIVQSTIPGTRVRVCASAPSSPDGCIRCGGEELAHHHRSPHATKAWRCFVTKASTVIGGRPPILSTKSLVPAKMPLVWSIATSRKCCTRNSLPDRPVMRSASA